MKIAIIIPSTENRGPNIFTKYLIEGLSAFDCSIHVYYFKKSKNDLEFLVPCFKLNFLKVNSFDKYDIVHTTMAIPDLYVFLYKKFIKAKHVISMHNLFPEDISFLYNPLKSFILINLWKCALGSKSTYIYSSNYMKKYYDKFIGEFDSRIIPYGIPSRFDLDADFDDKQFLINLKRNYTVIGSVGLIIKRKGFYQLIDLLALNHELAVVIIGEGNLSEELFNLAIEKGVRDRFHILGFRNDSSRYYQYFDIFAMVSFSEGFGMAMIESLAHGLPLLCSNLPIYDEIIPSTNVCFFDPGNIKELNFAYRKLVQNLEKYKVNSLKLYQERFSINKMAESHFALYSNLKEKVES